MPMSVVPARVAEETLRRPRAPVLGRILERESLLAYLFMMPGGLVLLLFMAYPFALGIYLSLTDKMVGFDEFSFVGLANFRYLIDDRIFRQTIETTFVYSF